MSAPGGSITRRVAIVTGGGRGLGRAHALALARTGLAVVVNDVGCATDGQGADGAVASGVVAEIVAGGGVAVDDGHDVGSLAGGAAVVQTALARYGRVDVVVNNAGVVVPAEIGDVDDAALDHLLAVHLKGTLGTTAAALPALLDQGWGRIVNTVSEVALRPGAHGAGYAIAKAAVWSATLATAEAVRGTGVTANAVSPGAATRMSAGSLDPRFDPAELDPARVADVVAWLASDDAGDVNGAVLHVAGSHVREYRVERRGDTPLVARVVRAVTAGR
jgi:NAD(P)-dependent dehydrogenase (short-subunit alcohol dehydrogenase family)